MAVLASQWVDATPFRAHLRFLMAVGSLSIGDISTLAGISSPATRHLLNGRDGRAVRRISPQMARKLIAVSVDDVRGLPWRLVPAERARTQLARLRDTGRADAEIADLAGVSAVDLVRLDGPAEHCSQLLTVRLTATVEAQGSRPAAGRRAAGLPVAA